MSANTTANDQTEIAAALQQMGLLRAGQSLNVTTLDGGVSCDVWHVQVDGAAEIVVKRALPKLRVTADWRAPPERSGTEADWLRLVATIDPRLVPEVLGEDRARHMLAMEYLPPQTHPVWKSELAAGRADAEFAAQVGEALAHIHAATANREDILHDYAHDRQFHALRLEPYLLHAAKAHADVAPRLRALVNGVATSRVALMQGDISPKNILVGPEGPVFLDAETACYGDPAFDLAFCLNHLLLKTVWHPEFKTAYLKCYAALSRAYLENVTWEEPEDLERRATPLLAALLLARVDGKSPAEYLIAEADKSAVRDAAKAVLEAPLWTLQDVADYFAGSSAR